MVIINYKLLDRVYYKLDDDQRNMYESILKDNINVVCVDAQAGTGKTYIAILSALTLLNEGKISKIYYVRFPDDRSLKLGYLPGDTYDKEKVYMEPLYSSCNEFGMYPEDVDNMISTEQLVVCTDITMRGTNIKNAFVIIDEAQNGHLSDLKLVLTRVHDDCKIVLIGHSNQYDNFKGTNEHAFTRYIEHLTKKSWAVQVNLIHNYRGKVSQWSDMID